MLWKHPSGKSKSLLYVRSCDLTRALFVSVPSVVPFFVLVTAFKDARLWQYVRPDDYFQSFSSCFSDGCTKRPLRKSVLGWVRFNIFLSCRQFSTANQAIMSFTNHLDHRLDHRVVIEPGSINFPFNDYIVISQFLCSADCCLKQPFLLMTGEAENSCSY